MQSIRILPCLASLFVLVVMTERAQAKEKYPVTISYTLMPERPLPPNIRSVAVTDAGVEIAADRDEAWRSDRWSVIAAQLIEALLQDAAQRGPAQLKVAERSATKKILDEQNPRLAGIVEGPAAEKAGKLLSVDGLAMSKIVIHIDTHQQEKDVVDWTHILGGVHVDVGNRHEVHFRRYDGYPYREHHTNVNVHIGLPVRTISEIRRSLTVQCSFALVAAANGRSIVQFTPSIYQKTDPTEPDFIFSDYIEEADLDPLDHFIGELVERAARDFVSMLVPMHVSYTYTVIGKGKHGEAAVRALRADDYPAAMREFEFAHQEDPKRDWHVFGMAVTAELMGDSRRALDLYREAASMPSVDKEDMAMYLSAKERLASQLPRIAREDRPAREHRRRD